MRAAIPTSSRILIILLPMTLPRSMSVSPVASEEIETASSGIPVPIEMTVRPMSCLDTLKWEAMEEAPETSRSAPLIKKTKPTISKIICKNISMLMLIIA